MATMIRIVRQLTGERANLIAMIELRSFTSLTLADFQDHPVWISVRSFDRGEPWFDEADEETFRLWDKELPFTNQRGIALLLRLLISRMGAVIRVSSVRLGKTGTLPCLPERSVID